MHAGSFLRSRASSSSSSDSSRAGPPRSQFSGDVHPYARGISTDFRSVAYSQPLQETMEARHDSLTSEDEDMEEMADEVRPPVPAPPSAYSQMNRPQSSLSSRRYRTPMASMMMSPPPASTSVPPAQPMPRYETLSAYAEPPLVPPSAYAATTASYTGHTSQFSRTDTVAASDHLPIQPPYRSASQHSEYTGRPYALQNPMIARLALERAVENVQTHLAALTERIESLENMAHRSTSSLVSPSGMRSPRWLAGNRGGSPIGGSHEVFTYEDMGMWSLVLNPLSAVMVRIRKLTDFLLYNESRSPTLVVVRRLMLDISFFLCLLAISRYAWRRSGSRRQALSIILRNIWWVIVGQQVPRALVDRGV